MSDVQITDNTAENRWEAHVDGALAGFAAYTLTSELVVFTHTEVFPQHEGQGVGGALARAALDDIRERGELKVMPLCPFIHGWIQRHPDYTDLVFNAPPSRVTD